MLSPRTDNIANAIRLLVAMGAFAAAPAPKSGLGVYDAIRKVATHPPKSLAGLADDLTGNARTVFAAYRDAPDGAAELFGQMVEQGLLTPADITAAHMDPTVCTAAMLARLTDPAHTTGEMPRLFAAVTEPALTTLLASNEYAADLTPAYMADVLQTTHRIEDKIDDVAGKLDNIQTQSRDTLDALALRFGEATPEALSLPDLKAFLIEKARDYRALREELEALRGTTPRIDNVLSAVESAIETLDLGEAERLLASVRETTAETLRKPLEDNARIMEAQARIALMRGLPERAFHLLSGAADSFAALDPLEPPRRRLTYARAFYEYGERFGGPVTEMAERVALAILAVVDSSNPGIFSEAQNVLGLSLLAQGRYATDAHGDDLLERAVAAFSAANTLAEGHLRGATLDNLALVRMTQSHRVAPPARTSLLRAAIEGSRAAIELFGDDLPSVARALNNLGNAYLMLADDLEGERLEDALDQAFAALDRATRLFGELGDIDNMAGARFGVATVFERQATAKGDSARRKHAIDEFDRALQFYRDRKMPQDAAMAAGALGSALLTHATQAPPEHIVPLLTGADSALAEAAVHYRDTGQPLLEVALLRKLAISQEMRALAAPATEAAVLLRQAQACLERAGTLGAAGLETEQLKSALERIRNKLAAMG